MAVRRHAHALARAEQLDDQARADRGLARARRSLDEEVAVVERLDRAQRFGGQVRLAFDHRRARREAAQSRRIAAQERARRAKAHRRRPATTASATRHTASRKASVSIGPDGPDRQAVGRLLLRAHLDRHQALRFVERVNHAQRLRRCRNACSPCPHAASSPAPGTCTRGALDRFSASGGVGVRSSAPRHSTSSMSSASVRSRRANTAHHSGLAVRRWKSRRSNSSARYVIVGRSGGLVLRHVGEERRPVLFQRCLDCANALGLVLLLLRILVTPHLEPRQALRPKLQQPVAQQLRGSAIVLVVVADAVELGGVLRQSPALVVHDGGAGIEDLAFARRHVEHLEVLDGQARLGGANAFAHDLVQVHELLAAQQVVELRLARAVQRHQALERGGLVVGVVVDVQARKPPRALDHEVDERFERTALLCAVVRPEGLELRLAARRRSEHRRGTRARPPRADRLPCRRRRRPHPVCGRRWKPRRPSPSSGRISCRGFPVGAALDLERRLRDELRERLAGHARNDRGGRYRGQCRNRVDASGVQPLDLVRA